jgi:ABC-type antimicrobial peptide transport system ATPase subunit
MQAVKNDSIGHDLINNIPVNTFKSVQLPHYVWKSGWQVSGLKRFSLSGPYSSNRMDVSSFQCVSSLAV